MSGRRLLLRAFKGSVSGGSCTSLVVCMYCGFAMPMTGFCELSFVGRAGRKRTHFAVGLMWAWVPGGQALNAIWSRFAECGLSKWYDFSSCFVDFCSSSFLCEVRRYPQEGLFQGSVGRICCQFSLHGWAGGVRRTRSDAWRQM